MNRNDLIATVAALVAVATAIVAPVAIVSHHSTERTVACVESGGQYLNVANTARMECVR